MAGNIKEITDAEFKQTVLDASLPVLVDFTATWCAPCRAMAPVLEELATAYQGQVTVAKINCDDNQENAQAYGVRSFPTLMLFRGGLVVEQIVGAVPRSRLEATLRKVV